MGTVERDALHCERRICGGETTPHQPSRMASRLTSGVVDVVDVDVVNADANLVVVVLDRLLTSRGS